MRSAYVSLKLCTLSTRVKIQGSNVNKTSCNDHPLSENI